MSPIYSNASLGNFLSGMETPVVGHLHRPRLGLGNFLSGMETYRSRPAPFR